VSRPNWRRGALQPVAAWSGALGAAQPRFFELLLLVFAGTLLASAVPIILVGPMYCGMYTTVLKHLRGEEWVFETLFGGFSWFVPSLVAVLMLLGVTLGPTLLASGGLVALWAVLAQTVGTEVAALVGILGSVGSAFLAACWFAMFGFVFPLLVDHDLAPAEALRISAAASRDNLGGVVGLLFLGVVAATVGLLACYVGVFVVTPIATLASAIAYEQVFERPERPHYLTVLAPKSGGDGDGWKPVSSGG
jgi:uncharacterized membrane protein